MRRWHIYVTIWWSLYELSFKEVSVGYNKLVGALYKLTLEGSKRRWAEVIVNLLVIMYDYELTL